MSTPTPPGGHAAVEDMSVLEFYNRMAARREAAAAQTMATHLARLATQVEENQPLSAAISTALKTAAQFARQMHSILDELPAAIARETEEARNKATNPAKGKPSVEEKNDSRANRDHV